MELSTNADDEVTAWIAEGRPPICFATGSIPVESPTDTIEMISAACAQLGERALVCGGGTDFSEVPLPANVMVVGEVNYPPVFAASRAMAVFAATPSIWFSVKGRAARRSNPLTESAAAMPPNTLRAAPVTCSLPMSRRIVAGDASSNSCKSRTEAKGRSLSSPSMILCRSASSMAIFIYFGHLCTATITIPSQTNSLDVL